jgi:hypothetical protein
VPAETKTTKSEPQVEDDDEEDGGFIESKGFLSEQDIMKEHEKKGTEFPL